MLAKLRFAPAVLSLALLMAPPAAGQQQAPPQAIQQQSPAPAQPQQPPAMQPAAVQSAVVQPAAIQPPPGFQLNQLQLAHLDQVLATWQTQSAKINTFKCSFERWEYDVAFGPGHDIPLNKNKGELSFGKPDKGSFQITEVTTWQATPKPPGQQPTAEAQGNWQPQPGAIGEHWVCDGESVFEYRHDQKQLVQRPIPRQLQGKAIVDGPLPFLFGAEAQKLKDRYWMRVEQQPNQNQIWLVALPKYQAQAADFKAVEVILDRQRLLPSHMQVHLPNGSRHMYRFDIENASVNSRLAQLQSLFQLPRLPVGWRRVVEETPIEQAAQPVQPPR